jgi:hypothetical protein
LIVNIDPCGTTGYDISSKSEGSSICVTKKVSPTKPQIQIQGTTNGTTTKTQAMLYLHQLPPSCGPFGQEIAPAFCGVKCLRTGVIPLPGSCHVYGRCYFARWSFVLYILRCPPKHRFDHVTRSCIPGTCVMHKVQKGRVNWAFSHPILAND